MKLLTSIILSLIASISIADDIEDVSTYCAAFSAIVATEDSSLRLELFDDVEWWLQLTTVTRLEQIKKELITALQFDRNRVWPLIIDGVEKCKEMRIVAE